MITWLQSVTQRHHKWVFSILLVIIIIAFVFTIGSVPIGRGVDQTASEDFFGVNLRDQNALVPVQENIGWHFRLTKQMPPSDRAYQEIIFDRIATDAAADSVDFPDVSQAEFSKFVTALPAFRKDNGEFDKTAYQSFMDDISSNPRISRAAVEHALNKNARAHVFSKILAGPGYALPEEAQMMLAQADADTVLEIAELDDAGILINLKADPEGQKAFYEANKAAYREGVKVEAEAVEFPAAAYAAKIEAPSEEKLREFFAARQTRAYKDKAFDDIKAQVAADYVAAMAARAAVQTAVDFAVAVENGRIDVGSKEWNALLAKDNAATRDVGVFGEGDTLQGIALSAEALAEVVEQLSRVGARAYSEPQATRDGAYIFVAKRVIAPRIPEYAEVEGKVAADYARYREAQARAQARAKTLAALKDAVKAGASFKDAAKAQGLENYNKTANFTIANAPEGVPISALYVAREASQGDIEMARTRDGKGALFVYVAQKKLPEIALDSPRVKAAADRLGRTAAAATSVAVTGQKVQAELVRSGVARQQAAE